MNLRITTPTRVIIDEPVAYVQAEGPDGRFGILPHHEPYLTSLVPSIIVYRLAGGGQSERYVAVRQGVLRVTAEGVHVAARDAHASDSLAALEEEVRRSRRHRDDRSYRSTRSLYHMQLAAWRRLVEFGDVRTR